MKKMLSLALVLALCLAMLPVHAAQEVVDVYNWYDYMDEEVFELFEQETGIHVNKMYFTTSPLVQNLSTLIYSQARKGIKPTMNALTALMFIVLLVLLLLVNKRTKEEE